MDVALTTKGLKVYLEVWWISTSVSCSKCDNCIRKTIFACGV